MSSTRAQFHKRHLCHQFLKLVLKNFSKSTSNVPQQNEIRKLRLLTDIKCCNSKANDGLVPKLIKQLIEYLSSYNLLKHKENVCMINLYTGKLYKNIMNIGYSVMHIVQTMWHETATCIHLVNFEIILEGAPHGSPERARCVVVFFLSS